MQGVVYRVLFLSRRNSARSIIAQAVLNKIGKGRLGIFINLPFASLDRMSLQSQVKQIGQATEN